ncbi:MAG: hypothetical protein EOP84_26450 [Verrucomicrobiaceae bacterium]|nr:MAG: hypothetical protein EOP84_26450 [Verrucomicrobiaceae bacterium]
MIDRPIFFQDTEPSAPKRRRTPNRWLARLMILVFATVLALGVAELATRLIWGRSVVLFPRFHTEATYGPYQLRRLEPSTTFSHTSADGTWKFTTNAQGFRDTEDYAYEKPDGVRRVLCLGDSQTQGFEARQDRIFPAVIERRLQRMGYQVEVLNTGISGFGTSEELAFFENEGIRYKPDVVVLAWYINDFNDNEKTGLFKLREGILMEEKYEHAPGIAPLRLVNSIPGLEWASQHSYFYSLLFNRAWEARKHILSQQQNASMQEDLTTRVPHQGADISAYQLDLSAALVQRLYEICQKHGIKLVIVDIPWLPHDNTGFGSSLPEALATKFEESSDELLQAREVLGRYSGITDIFVPHGQHHISETSHLLIGMAAAEKIAEWWTEKSPQ